MELFFKFEMIDASFIGQAIQIGETAIDLDLHFMGILSLCYFIFEIMAVNFCTHVFTVSQDMGAQC